MENDSSTSSRKDETLGAHEVLSVGSEIQLNLTTGFARRGDRSATLPRFQARLLATFIRNPGRVVTYQELMDELWDGLPSRSALHVLICRLRAALGTDLVETVRGIGYRLPTSDPTLPADGPAPLRVGSLELDPSMHLASRRGRPVQLSPLCAEVLATFMEHPGRVISRQELKDEHWGGFTSENNLLRVIGLLRAALGDDVIETVRGRGYRLGTEMTDQLRTEA